MITVSLTTPIRGDNGDEISSVVVRTVSRRAYKRRPRTAPEEIYNLALISGLSLSEAGELTMPDMAAIVREWERIRTSELIASGHLARNQSGELIAGPAL